MNCAAAWRVGLATTVARPREARYALTAERRLSCNGSALAGVDCVTNVKQIAATQRPREANLTRASLPMRPDLGRLTLPHEVGELRGYGPRSSAIWARWPSPSRVLARGSSGYAPHASRVASPWRPIRRTP